MGYKKNNSPVKQTIASNLLNTAMGAANAQPNTGYANSFGSITNGSVTNTLQNAFNTVAGTSSQANMNQAVRSLQNTNNPNGFINTPRPNQPQSSVVRGNPRYIRNTINNRNGMSYDNTTGPRPMAPINPRGFSNMDNVQRIFNSSYSNTPLAQVDVDPMTGQQMNPLNDQSTNSPMIPDIDSAMSPLPNPNGVQTDSLAPYYGLSN